MFEQLVYSPKSLGSAIKRQRKFKKLNQSQTGQAFKLEQTTISSVERGAGGTRIETVFRILASLELEMVIRSKNNTSDKSFKNPKSTMRK